jgi:hypothetical protein
MVISSRRDHFKIIFLIIILLKIECIFRSYENFLFKVLEIILYFITHKIFSKIFNNFIIFEIIFIILIFF